MKPALRADDSSIRHVVGRQRHVDGENAAFAGYIPDVDVAFVCPDGLASNRQPQAEPRPISPAPLTERLNGSPTVGDTPALVFHLDQESCAFGADPQNHLASGSRGFERIVQEVRDGRLQKLRVPGYHPFRVDGRHNERKATDLGVQRACVRDVIEKRPDSDLLTFLVLGSQSDISLLVGNKIAQFHEAPPQHESRAAVDGNSAPLQHLIGHEGSGEFITKLMSDMPQPFGLFGGGASCGDAPVFGDGFRDGRVQAPIERVELFSGDRGVLLQGKLRHGLTDVPIIVNDRREREPKRQQVGAMSGRRVPNRIGREGRW
jgi:hypothetical protein